MNVEFGEFAVDISRDFRLTKLAVPRPVPVEDRALDLQVLVEHLDLVDAELSRDAFFRDDCLRPSVLRDATADRQRAKPRLERVNRLLRSLIDLLLARARLRILRAHRRFLYHRWHNIDQQLVHMHTPFVLVLF